MAKKTTSTHSKKVDPPKKKMAVQGEPRKKTNYDNTRIVAGTAKGFVPKSWDEVKAKEPQVKIEDIPEEVRAYPPPRRHPTFVARWCEYVMDVVRRENFKTGHLAQLKILCDLHVEYDDLLEELKENGYTYQSIGRNGVQVKEQPTVAMMARVRSNIITYSKVLGLLLVKDKELGGGFEAKKKKEKPEDAADESWD